MPREDGGSTCGSRRTASAMPLQRTRTRFVGAHHLSVQTLPACPVPARAKLSMKKCHPQSGPTGEGQGLEMRILNLHRIHEVESVQRSHDSLPVFFKRKTRWSYNHVFYQISEGRQNGQMHWLSAEGLHGRDEALEVLQEPKSSCS